jgi:hypothetical protein
VDLVDVEVGGYYELMLLTLKEEKRLVRRD